MKCEGCGGDNSGEYGSGRFCSRGCANKRAPTDETKKKIANALKGKGGGFLTEEQKHKLFEANKVWKEKQLNELMTADFSTLKYERRRKRVILEQDGKCNHCGIKDWMNKPISLELEHKNGNTDDNTRENLEAICPNCHSQTVTFRGRNKKAGEKCPRTKITDAMIVDAFIEVGNVRQCLLKLGMAAKGDNYGRVKRALTIRGIDVSKEF